MVLNIDKLGPKQEDDTLPVILPDKISQILGYKPLITNIPILNRDNNMTVGPEGTRPNCYAMIEDIGKFEGVNNKSLCLCDTFGNELVTLHPWIVNTDLVDGTDSARSAGYREHPNLLTPEVFAHKGELYLATGTNEGQYVLNLWRITDNGHLNPAIKNIEKTFQAVLSTLLDKYSQPNIDNSKGASTDTLRKKRKQIAIETMSPMLIERATAFLQQPKTRVDINSTPHITLGIPDIVGNDGQAVINTKDCAAGEFEMNGNEVTHKYLIKQTTAGLSGNLYVDQGQNVTINLIVTGETNTPNTVLVCSQAQEMLSRELPKNSILTATNLPELNELIKMVSESKEQSINDEEKSRISRKAKELLYSILRRDLSEIADEKLTVADQVNIRYHSACAILGILSKEFGIHSFEVFPTSEIKTKDLNPFIAPITEYLNQTGEGLGLYYIPYSSHDEILAVATWFSLPTNKRGEFEDFVANYRYDEDNRIVNTPERIARPALKAVRRLIDPMQNLFASIVNSQNRYTTNYREMKSWKYGQRPKINQGKYIRELANEAISQR